MVFFILFAFDLVPKGQGITETRHYRPQARLQQLGEALAMVYAKADKDGFRRSHTSQSRCLLV